MPTSDNTKLSSGTILKIIGLVFLLLSVGIALFIPCPTKIQYFIIYALVGMGIAMLFSSSSKSAKLTMDVKNISIFLGGGVVLPFILFFTNPIGSFKTDQCDARIALNIMVHGRNGKQDIVLREGKVNMIHNGETKVESIDEKGVAHFRNLLVGDKVSLEVDYSAPYRSVYKDSVFTVTEEGIIYLEVALQGIDRVKGKVIDFQTESPLEKVVVSLDELRDTTDATGYFSITIPENLQNPRGEYKLWFLKEGYRSVSKNAFPQTGQAVEISMEKISE